MANEKMIEVYEQITKTQKGRPSLALRKVKTDGTLEASKKAIASLKKKGVLYFEVVDEINNLKTVYRKMLFGKNYQIKVFKS